MKDERPLHCIAYLFNSIYYTWLPYVHSLVHFKIGLVGIVIHRHRGGMAPRNANFVGVARSA